MQIRKISVYGSGYVGAPTAAVMAKFTQASVCVYDINPSIIQCWKKFEPPIKQQGLLQILLQTKDKLEFSTDYQKVLTDTDCIFLALPTPNKGFGMNDKAHDLSYTQKAVRQIAKFVDRSQRKSPLIIVEKSTVPVKTSDQIMRIMKQNQINHPKNIDQIHVVSNPQFLAQSTAVRDLIYPDRVIIGGNNKQSIQALANLYLKWVKQDKIITTSLYSSELSKLAANSFLAQRISSINSISMICEEIGSDIKQLQFCIGSDSRIGKKYLKSGLGFGGSCLRKDLLSLVYLAQCLDLHDVAQYWLGVDKMNTLQQKRLLNKIMQNMNNTLKGKKILLLGYAFKANTGDVRQSIASIICNSLLIQKCQLICYDPKASPDHLIEDMKRRSLYLPQFEQRFKFTKDIYQGVAGCQGIVICTDWQQFQRIQFSRLISKMQRPAYIFDGRNCISRSKVEACGFEYYCI